jgi:putative transposase
MIAMRDKSTILTPMFSRGESFSHTMTALRAILRRVGRIHFDYLTTSIFRFVRQNRGELTPSRVANALGEMMVLNHSSHVQIFNGDRVKLLDEIERRLVMKVRALALNLLMLLRQQRDRFSPSLRSLFAARDFALSRFQFAFGLTQEFRVLNCFASREIGEVFDPDINPDRLASFREESALVFFNRKDHVPTIGLALDHASLDRPLDWTGKVDTARTDLRQMEFVAFDPKAALRIGKGIIPGCGPESRVARRFPILHTPKESVEGFIHTSKSVLKDLTVYRADVFADFLDLRKLNGLSVVVDRNAIHPVSVASLLDRGVIQFAAKVKRCAACGFKVLVDLQLVLVRLHLPHYTLVIMAKQHLQALYHCVFSLQFHLVLVTKHRRKVISEEMKKRLGGIFLDTLRKWECELIEFNGEADHVHLLFSATPKVALSVLVNNLKTVSSRLIRKEFTQEVSKVYWKPVFWHRSYCLLTCGGAPLSVIKQYIQQQGEP